jgi:hypothetical protein
MSWVNNSNAAIKMLADLVRREALVLTYNDLLLLIGSLFIFAGCCYRWSAALARFYRINLSAGADRLSGILGRR